MFLTLFSFTFLEHCCRPTADFLAKFDVCVCITQPCGRPGSGCRMVRHSQGLGQKYYQKTQTPFLRALSYSTIEWFNCGITGQFHPICGEGIYNKHMNVLTNELQCLSQYCEIVNALSSVYPAPKWIIFYHCASVQWRSIRHFDNLCSKTSRKGHCWFLHGKF